MLAQSFLTAEALNIPEPHRQALMKTLVLLETGKLVHVPNNNDDDWEMNGDDSFTGHFNMGTWRTPYKSCGTVCCIGGTAEAIGGVDFRTMLNGDLYELFFPYGAPGGFDLITPSQAAIALRSYLTTGAANWKEALRS